MILGTLWGDQRMDVRAVSQTDLTGRLVLSAAQAKAVWKLSQ